MKTITLIQRLRTGFGGLCLAAIVVGTLIAWQAVRAVKRQLAAEALHRQVSVTVERMRLATLTIGYALRGVMLDPGNQAERNRKREADSELSRLVGELRPLIREHPELIRALEAVGDHDTTKLTVIEDQVMDLAARARIRRAPASNSRNPTCLPGGCRNSCSRSWRAVPGAWPQRWPWTGPDWR